MNLTLTSNHGPVSIDPFQSETNCNIFAAGPMGRLIESHVHLRRTEKDLIGVVTPFARSLSAFKCTPVDEDKIASCGTFTMGEDPYDLPCMNPDDGWALTTLDRSSETIMAAALCFILGSKNWPLGQTIVLDQPHLWLDSVHQLEELLRFIRSERGSAVIHIESISAESEPYINVALCNSWIRLIDTQSFERSNFGLRVLAMGKKQVPDKYWDWPMLLDQDNREPRLAKLFASNKRAA